MRVVCNANESFNALKMEGRGSRKVWLHIVMHILLKWKWKPLEMPSVTCMKSDAKKKILKCFTLLPICRFGVCVDRDIFRWSRYDIAIFFVEFAAQKIVEKFSRTSKRIEIVSFTMKLSHLISRNAFDDSY